MNMIVKMFIFWGGGLYIIKIANRNKKQRFESWVFFHLQVKRFGQKPWTWFRSEACYTMGLNS
jgi:hypothetical protein